MQEKKCIKTKITVYISYFMYYNRIIENNNKGEMNMTKKDMALKIVQQLFPENPIDEWHWKVVDLMTRTVSDLRPVYKLALKAEAAYKEMDKAEDNL